MGLDVVELVLEIEEEFGISVPDDQPFFFSTLGGIHDFLLEKCAGRRRADCPTRSAFYRLRHALEAVLGGDLHRARPTALVLPLLGRWHRRRKWRQIERQSGLVLPALDNAAGPGVLLGALVASATGFLFGLVATRDAWNACGIALVGLLPGALLGYVAGLCWLPAPARGYRTLGGLARGIVALNDQFRPAQPPETEGDPIWERLCRVVIDQLSVPKGDLRRDTRLLDLFPYG